LKRESQTRVQPVESPEGVIERVGSLAGDGRRFVMVVARFNHGITSRLAAAAVAAFRFHGVASEDLELIRVPGAFELPSACMRAVERGGTDGVVALGCVIRGETPHFDFVAKAASRGLGDLSVQAVVPVVFGVLTTDTLEQALDRAGPGEENKGWEAAVSALEMANLYAELQ
jgi:6,7-dimethyl-8-ribityllumazine synthase